jgi:hypothetical protein
MMGEQLRKDLDQTRDAWNKDHLEMQRKLAAALAESNDLRRKLVLKSAQLPVPPIDWKGHYDSLKMQADAKITALEKGLKSAAEYIEGLERDVALLSNRTNEKLPTTDTIFFQFDNAVEELGRLQDYFPNNRVVALPEGVTFHAVAQIHG